MLASVAELRIFYGWFDSSNGRINGFDQPRKLVATIFYMISVKSQIRRRGSIVWSNVSKLYVTIQRPLLPDVGKAPTMEVR